MVNFSMNQGSHNNPPPSPHTPRPSTNADNGHAGPDGAAGLSARRTSRNPSLDGKLKQMALPLAPLVQLTSGHIHPAFPSTLLHFWLLTDDQLDQIAHFYHQRTPCQWTRHYPCPITWGEGLSVEEKRRKIGKFIGLRGVSTFFLFLLLLFFDMFRSSSPFGCPGPAFPPEQKNYLVTKVMLTGWILVRDAYSPQV